MPFTSRVPWRAKLENAPPRKVVSIPEKMQKRFGPGTMLIPRPLDVDALIRRARKGQLITPQQIREALAREHKANVTCPLVTGIFIRIAAEASVEDARNGMVRVTPYWRVVSDDGALNPKFPGGVARQAAKLRAEGHKIVSGKKPRVAEVARRVAKL